MKSEIRDQLVAALRSGEYLQGQGKLRKTDPQAECDRFCCLGVLSDLAAKAGVLEWSQNKHDGEWSMNGNTGFLTGEVQDWAGMQTDDGTLGAPYEAIGTLVGLNDKGYSFASIARVIETQGDAL